MLSNGFVRVHVPSQIESVKKPKQGTVQVAYNIPETKNINAFQNKIVKCTEFERWHTTVVDHTSTA